jgi:hypothetical protein
MATDYPGGVFRLYPFKVHEILDYGVAAASAFMPEMTGIRPHSAEGKFFRIQGTGKQASRQLRSTMTARDRAGCDKANLGRDRIRVSHN